MPSDRRVLWLEAMGFEFETMEDAVAIAMMHAPANRELVGLRTADERVMRSDQILRVFEFRGH